MQPANDNRSPSASDKLVERTTTNAAVIHEHLGTGLQAMLKSNHVSPPMRSALREFLAPALALLDQTEKAVVDYAASHGNPVLARLELYVEEFARLATSPEQVRLAADFRQYVAGLEAGPVPLPQAAVAMPVEVGFPANLPALANDSPFFELEPEP